MCWKISIFILQTSVLTTLNILTHVHGHAFSPAWRQKNEENKRRSSTSDIHFKCLSSPNSKLLLAQLWTPPSSSSSSPGVTDLDVLSTDSYMSSLAPGCLHRNLTSREPITLNEDNNKNEGGRSRRHLTLPVLESSSISLTFDLEARGCGVQRYKVAHGYAYRYFFRTRHFDVDGTTKTTSSKFSSKILTSDEKVALDGASNHAPKKTYPKVLYSVHCYFYANGRIKTEVDEKSDVASVKRTQLPVRSITKMRPRRFVKKVWSSDNVGPMVSGPLASGPLQSPVSPSRSEIDARELWDLLKTKSLPIFDPGTDLTSKENISLDVHFREMTRTYMKVVKPGNAHSFIRGLLHAVDDTIKDIMDRRTLAPETRMWGVESTNQRRSKLYEKRLAIIVGVVLAVLLLATILMIALVGSDFRRRRAGEDAAAARPSASFCHRLCPSRFFSVKTGGAVLAPDKRPLPPLPHSEGMIELPPSILNNSDIILVDNV